MTMADRVAAVGASLVDEATEEVKEKVKPEKESRAAHFASNHAVYREDCPHCQRGQSRRRAHRRRPKAGQADGICFDLSGPHEPTFMPRGRLGHAMARFTLIAVYTQEQEDGSHLQLPYVELLKSKDDAVEAVKRIIARVRSERGPVVRAHTDRGGEFLNATLSSAFFFFAEPAAKPGRARHPSRAFTGNPGRCCRSR